MERRETDSTLERIKQEHSEDSLVSQGVQERLRRGANSDGDITGYRLWKIGTKPLRIGLTLFKVSISESRAQEDGKRRGNHRKNW